MVFHRAPRHSFWKIGCVRRLLFWPGGSFHLTATGPDGAWFNVQYSTDLGELVAVSTNQVFQGSIDFVDPDGVEQYEPVLSRRSCRHAIAISPKATTNSNAVKLTASSYTDLCGQMLDAVNHYLESRGIRITTGTIVDATIVHAPSSTKNEKKEAIRKCIDQEGQSMVLRHKAHIGVDSKEGIVHSVCSTAASVSDMQCCPELLHGGEKKVWGDAGYQGQTEAIREAAPQAQDMTSRRVKTKAGMDQDEKRRNRTKARVRAKVEWPVYCVL